MRISYPLAFLLGACLGALSMPLWNYAAFLVITFALTFLAIVLCWAMTFENWEVRYVGFTWARQAWTIVALCAITGFMAGAFLRALFI